MTGIRNRKTPEAVTFDSKPFGRESALLNDSPLARRPVGQRAFAGFVPIRDEVAAPQQLLGRKPLGIRWSQQVLAGIKADDADIVLGGLAMEYANVDTQLCKCGAGAPFSYDNAALFAESQMQELVAILKEGVRNHATAQKLFVSQKEMSQIDNELEAIGHHSRVNISLVVNGDSGMTLALRFGSTQAARAFIEMDADVMLENEEKESASDFLQTNYEKLKAVLKRIQELRVQDASTFLAPLTEEEHKLVAAERRVALKCNEYRLLALDMCVHLKDRIDGLPKLRAIEHSCRTLGRSLDPRIRRELDLHQPMMEHLARLEAVVTDPCPQLPPLSSLESQGLSGSSNNSFMIDSTSYANTTGGTLATCSAYATIGKLQDQPSRAMNVIGKVRSVELGPHLTLPEPRLNGFRRLGSLSQRFSTSMLKLNG